MEYKLDKLEKILLDFRNDTFKMEFFKAVGKARTRIRKIKKKL